MPRKKRNPDGGRGKTTEEKQRIAIVRLLEGKSRNQVAEEIGVTELDVWNWQFNDEHFKTEYNRIKDVDFQVAIPQVSTMIRNLCVQQYKLAMSSSTEPESQSKIIDSAIKNLFTYHQLSDDLIFKEKLRILEDLDNDNTTI